MTDLRQALDAILRLCSTSTGYTRRIQQIHETAMIGLGMTQNQREGRHKKLMSGAKTARELYLQRQALRGVPKVYLAGPMTGLPDLNFPAFHAEALRLRAMGNRVINPAEGAYPDWNSAMRADLALLVTCSHISYLPGWTRSKGAGVENVVAEALELEVLDKPEV